MELLRRLRRPEYTGANRCWPCTAVNALALLVLTAAVGIVAPLLGIFVLVAGGLAIALRGYFLPYTPAVATPLVNAIPGASTLFVTHDRDRTEGGLGDDDADGERLLGALLDAGVLTGDEELDLDDEFTAEWQTEMGALRDEPIEALATAVADAAPTTVETRVFTDDGDEWVILTDGAGSLASETWLSRPVAVADVAALRVLTARGLDPQTAADASVPLRLFLEECPDCGGALVETTGDGCCGGFGPGGPTNVLACADCAQRIAILD